MKKHLGNQYWLLCLLSSSPFTPSHFPRPGLSLWQWFSSSPSIYLASFLLLSVRGPACHCGRVAFPLLSSSYSFMLIFFCGGFELIFSIVECVEKNATSLLVASRREIWFDRLIQKEIFFVIYLRPFDIDCLHCIRQWQKSHPVPWNRKADGTAPNHLVQLQPWVKKSPPYWQ